MFVFPGVSFVTRQVGNNVSPVVHLTVDGDTYSLTSSSAFKNSTITFKLGEPFDQETPDGRMVKATIVLEGDNKLIETQEPQGSGKASKIIREFSPTEIKMVSFRCRVGGVNLTQRNSVELPGLNCALDGSVELGFLGSKLCTYLTVNFFCCRP